MCYSMLEWYIFVYRANTVLEMINLFCVYFSQQTIMCLIITCESFVKHWEDLTIVIPVNYCAGSCLESLPKKGYKRLTKMQVAILEKSFQSNPILTSKPRKKLAKTLQESEVRISNWFAYRRYCQRKTTGDTTAT